MSGLNFKDIANEYENQLNKDNLCGTAEKIPQTTRPRTHHENKSIKPPLISFRTLEGGIDRYNKTSRAYSPRQSESLLIARTVSSPS